MEAVDIEEKRHALAKDLTERCGLSHLVTHSCCDILNYSAKGISPSLCSLWSVVSSVFYGPWSMGYWLGSMVSSLWPWSTANSLWSLFYGLWSGHGLLSSNSVDIRCSSLTALRAVRFRGELAVHLPRPRSGGPISEDSAAAAAWRTVLNRRPVPGIDYLLHLRSLLMLVY